jgi:hypothetical protein
VRSSGIAQPNAQNAPASVCGHAYRTQIVFIGGLMHFPPVSAPAIGLIASVIGDGTGAGLTSETGSGVGSTAEGLVLPLITRLPIPTISAAATTSPAINFIMSTFLEPGSRGSKPHLTHSFPV